MLFVLIASAIWFAVACLAKATVEEEIKERKQRESVEKQDQVYRVKQLKIK